MKVNHRFQNILLVWPSKGPAELGQQERAFDNVPVVKLSNAIGVIGFSLQWVPPMTHFASNGQTGKTSSNEHFVINGS